jgi:hypothetical protein
MDVRTYTAGHRLVLMWERVSIPQLVAGLALTCSLATSLLITQLWQVRVDALDDGRIDRYGEALSAQIATLAVEPLIAGDRIRLGVLAQRMSEFPEIATVSVQTIDDRTVAQAGAAHGHSLRHYTYPIAFEETLAGHVRVAVDPSMLRAPGAGQLWLPALLMVLISGGLGYAVGLHLAARTVPRPRVSEDAPHTAESEAGSERYLFVANLFNLGSMPAEHRVAIMAAVQQCIAEVTEPHAAVCTELAGTGTLVTFTPAADGDDGFVVLRAALQCADALETLNDRLRRDGVPRLVFRFGLHIAPVSAEIGADEDDASRAATDADPDAMADTVLLSAVARNGTIATSTDVFERLGDVDRIEWQMHQNPILDTMTTSAGDSCVLVTDLTDEYRGTLDTENPRRGQPAATVNASTF